MRNNNHSLRWTICQSVDSLYCILDKRQHINQEADGHSLKEHNKLLTYTEHCNNKNYDPYHINDNNKCSGILVWTTVHLWF